MSDNVATRTVAAILTLVIAAIAGYNDSWWVAAGVMAIGVVLFIRPAWGGENWWP